MRRTFVALTAVSMLSVPGVAFAAAADCPPAVQAVPGIAPDPIAQRAAVIDAAAETHGVPQPLLRAVAFVESRWLQSPSGAGVGVSEEGCRIGMLRVPVDGYAEADQVRLAEDWVYNVGEGARLLRAAWDAVHGDAAEPVDRLVVENWFHAVCAYGDCGTDDTYPTLVAHVVRDPFRYANAFPPLRPYWFTTPGEAKADYAFPAPFVASDDPDTFDFGGESVEAPVHRWGTTVAPVTGYGEATFGPEQPSATCTGCLRWQLTPGAGLVGRARWAESVTGAAQATVSYAPGLPGHGKYRVRVWIPALGETPLGTATYTIDGQPVTVDQDAAKGSWRSLGDHELSPGDKVVLADSSVTAGMPIVADAIRFSAVTRLALDPGDTSITYGDAVTLRLSALHVPGGVTANDDGWRATLEKRRFRDPVWKAVAVLPLDSQLDVRPSASSYYRLRWTSDRVSYESAISNVALVRVAPRVRATIEPAVVDSGGSATIRAAIAPSYAGRTVYLMRLVDRAWQRAAVATVSATSRVRFTVSKPPGVYRYRVYVRGTTTRLAGWSATLRYEVLS